MKKRYLIVALSAALTSVWGHGVANAGHHENPTATRQAQKRSETYTLSDIVVTASRADQAIKETPAIISVITREDIDRMNATTLREALASQAGILVNGGNTGAAVSIRGTTERHNLILIDGKTFAHDLDRKFSYGAELDRIPLDNVERIEIVRGSYSTMYGSEAIGGVINIITKKKTPRETSFYWHKTTGEDRSDTKGFSISGDANNHLHIRAGAAQRKTKPNYDRENLPYQYSGTTNTYYLNASYDLAAGRTLSLALDYLNQDYKQKDLDYFDNPQNSFYDHDRWNMSLEYKGSGKSTDYFLRAYRSVYEKTAYRKTPDGTPKRSVYTAYMKSQLYALEGQYRRYWGKNTFTIGAQYRQDKPIGNRQKAGGTYIGQEKVNGFSVPLYEVSLTQRSLYLQNEWRPTEKWLFLVGVRYDMHNRFANKLSPNAGAVYFIGPHDRIKANYSKGYAVPGVNELYLEWGGIYGDPHLKPEESQSFDISYEMERGHYQHKFTFFYNDIKNFIDLYNRDPNDPFGKWYYQNIAEVKLHGFEYESKLRLNENFDARLGMMILRSNDAVIDGQSFYAPTYRSHTKIDLGVTYHKNDWTATLWGDYIGKNKDSKRSPVYQIWNLVINKEIGRNFTASAGVYNLFDKKITRRYEFGRSFRFTLTAKI